MSANGNTLLPPPCLNSRGALPCLLSDETCMNMDVKTDPVNMDMSMNIDEDGHKHEHVM